MSDLSDKIFGKISGDLDPFKKILSKIPGFNGYVERSTRRDSDKLLRDTIFRRVRELENKVSALQRDFISHGELQNVGALETSALKLRTFADRVHTAARGYAGIFDAIRINETELAQIYQYDASLLDLTDQADRAIDNIQASLGTDGLPAAIRNLDSVTQQMIDTFDQRKEVIIGSTPEQPKP